jgi:hypothetical protein
MNQARAVAFVCVMVALVCVGLIRACEWVTNDPARAAVRKAALDAWVKTHAPGGVASCERPSFPEPTTCTVTHPKFAMPVKLWCQDECVPR